MTLEPYLPLLLFTLVATGTPGAATTVATASGAHFGFRRSLPVMLGSAAGIGVLGAAAAAGLAALLLAEPSLELALRVCGSAYLLWLAWRIGRAGAPRQRNLERPTGFISGVLILWQNPKAWATTTSAAASFAGLASGPFELALLLGLSFALVAFGSLCLWCLAGQALGRLLTSERQWRALNLVLALLLVVSILPLWL